jgi:hypothetical protein
LIIATIETISDPGLVGSKIPDEILLHFAVIKSIQKAVTQSKYQVEKLIEAVK